MIALRAVGSSAGIAIGPVAHFRPVPVTAATPFPVLRDRATARLRSIAHRLREADKPAEAAIFDAQALLVADPALEAAVATRVAGGLTDVQAIRGAVEELSRTLEQLSDPYLRERAADIRAAGAVLLEDDADVAYLPPSGTIAIAEELTPAEVVSIPWHDLRGVIVVRGTAVDHTAILLRALGVPAVLGVDAAALRVPDGTLAIVDGDGGCVLLDPDPASRQHYASLQERRQTEACRNAGLRSFPAETTDGQRLALWANIAEVEEATAARVLGAEGIGLCRTEFLFLTRAAPPPEDEQYEVYVALLDRMEGRPVVIRTLDVGGDKPLPYLPARAERNPCLGERGIRHAQRFPDLFRTQLRALLRAATAGDLRITLPMITTRDDVTWARAQLLAASEELARTGTTHRADVPLGIMIETPAAAVMADRLARAVSFFSVGSNDLAQYALAADRTLHSLADRYTQHDPAIFRLIAMAIKGARQAGIQVSVCGEIAGEPAAAEALLGLGVDELSMAPRALAAVKARIRRTTAAAARTAARRACEE